MTNQEINEAVARKLGYERRDGIKEGYYEWIHPGSKLWVNLPDYCTSIAAAWEVVEYLQLQEYLTHISAKSHPSYKFFSCEIRSYKRDKPKIIIIESADTAPMAICLAFLKGGGINEPRVC